MSERNENTHLVDDCLIEEEYSGVINAPRRYIRFIAIAVALFCAAVVSLYWFITNLNQPPDNFPTYLPVTIEQGTEVRKITELLKEAGVVKSNTLLYYALVIFFEPKDIKASTHVFEKPLTTAEVAKRLAEGDFDADLIRFTHYEGERVSQLAARAEEVLPEFDSETFIANAEVLEGKLFPETYFIPPNYTSADLQNLMLETFETNLRKVQPLIDAQSMSVDEIIVVASIIEREADSLESKKMVAGILKNRMAINMPLQTDASIEYILDKPLSELVPDDLKIDSPYNTYLNTGLPPTPIGNPGLDAIKAVLEPTPSEYYYYITGNDGEFYYSKTYEEHLLNIEKYLR